MEKTVEKSETKKPTPDSVARHEFEHFSRLLDEGVESSRIIALNELARISHSPNPELAEKCISRIGSYLTEDAPYTTGREKAAESLGDTENPLALDYLEKVFKQPNDGEKIFFSTVRAKAARSIIRIGNSTNAQDKATQDRIEKLLSHIAETDRFNAKRIAGKELGRRHPPPA
ncbi:MAG: HEAT repeat domain-containing protein [Methanobacteriota archaeon]